MALFDGKGNSIETSAKIPSILNGADIVFFGDSNVFFSAGSTLADIGSLYQRLEAEFGIKSWVNKGTPGRTTWQAYDYDFKVWATDEMAEQYNKETTVLLFGYGTNDILTRWTKEYDGNESTVSATNAVAFIREIIAEKFPKASYHWIIPPATDWGKWTGSTEPDERNMAEKMPYIIKNLEKWQFPYCDMYHTSGITTDMLRDGIHMGQAESGACDYTTDAVYKYYRRLREYLMDK